jgi:hypothetical protein
MRIHHGGTETQRKSKCSRRLAQINADLSALTRSDFLISADLRLSAANIFCFSPRLRARGPRRARCWLAGVGDSVVDLT